MLYGDYLATVVREFNGIFDRITAHHNMEFGDEFEIALCQALRKILPDRFGICRGYIVTSAGTHTGDDIVVFNRENFVTLRLLDQQDFSRKECIPFDTVCAYIEAKHCLSLSGDDGQSIGKALSQVAAVKALTRRKIPLNEIKGVTFGDGHTVTVPKGWPDHSNPLFTCIWSRRVRQKRGGEVLQDPQAILGALNETDWSVQTDMQPDLMVLGPNVVFLPQIGVTQQKRLYVSPFFIPGKSTYTAQITEVAIGIAICSLLFALDNMQTDTPSYRRLIADGLGKLK